MTLAELDPRWIITEEPRRGMGLGFDCPHCIAAGADPVRLVVWFANPLDGGAPAHPAVMPAPRWQRAGETFGTLTLTPSIDASVYGHWHGWISNGLVRTA